MKRVSSRRHWPRRFIVEHVVVDRRELDLAITIAVPPARSAVSRMDVPSFPALASS
jgi:hypothetical protein